MLEVRLLGKFVVERDGKPVAISSRSAQALFAYLILSAGNSHRREKLAGLLWPDSLEETARDNLRHALWRVRKALESAASTRFLHADDLTVSFKVSAEYWLDAAELEKLSDRVSADELMAGLSVFEGELLPGFYDEWVVLEREHLHSIFEHHMARLMSLLQDEKRWLDILDWGERWIKLGQKPEPAYRALMSAHAAKDDMSKVVATYERCAKSLREFGIEPSEQTRALYERLKAGKETLETGSAVPMKEKRKESPKSNLPVPLTSFIGREKEIEEIVRLLGKHRLITLMGSGGVGKTRLAIEAANRMLSKFKDGIWWIDLVGLSDPSLVLHAVAQAIDVREVPNQPLIETMVEHLKAKQILLVLDNCEHLINACAQLVDRLLSGSRNLRILATSREALDILGEIAWHVPSLSLPEVQQSFAVKSLRKFESVRLFAERAEALMPQFSLTEQNAKTIVQICRRLSGMPLAIELAAARVKMMSAGEIARRLDDRFDLLTAGNRTALPRHQTLRATIDWSFDLLSEAERILFRRLSVFASGFTLDAAEAVAGNDNVSKAQVIDLLGQLINKSLVTMLARSQEADIGTRYGMLETIRAYAREKLQESRETERVRQRHCDFFVALAEQAEPGLKSADQFEWLDRLEVEYDNLRAAWDCAIESDADLALRLASTLLDFWHMRGNPSEGREWSAKLLERTKQQGQSVKRARVLAVAGRLAFIQQNFELARSLLEDALPIARGSGDRREIAFALLWLGRTAHRQHDDRAAQALTEECLTIYQELQDEWGTAMAFYMWAGVAAAQGHHAGAQEAYMKSLLKFQELGDKIRAGYVLNGLGELARLLGDYERAGKFYEQYIEILREHRSPVALVTPSVNLAWVILHGGNHRKAQALFEESLKRYKEYGNKTAMADCLAGFAGVLGMTGKADLAARLFGAVESLLEGIAGRLDPSDQKEFDYYVTAIRGQLDEATYEKAWAEGRAMTLEQAIEFALTET